jgi:16S rRNA (guanine966-N2)-methyltransferase
MLIWCIKPLEKFLYKKAVRVRILAGQYKNKTIATSLKGMSKQYRPTSSKVRSAVFNLLTHSPLLATILNEKCIAVDVCCGSGSFGFEALSRGVEKVFFVDKDREAMRLVRHNQELLKLSNLQVEPLLRDAKAAFGAIVNANIIYIDPPYDSKIYSAILAAIGPKNLSEDHVVIIETSVRTRIPLPATWQVLMEREYGSTKVLLLTYSMPSSSEL